MFQANPITKIELAYLREIAPHRWWHFLFMLPIFTTASLPLFHRFHRGNGSFVLTMTIIILGTYWLIQFRTMLLARKIAQHDFKAKLPDEFLGTVSNRQIVMGRLWAILRHQWVWSVLNTFFLLGLSLAVMGWKYRIFPSPETAFPWHSRGLIEYVGVPYYLVIYPDCNSCLAYFPHIFHLGLAFVVLFTLIKTQTILTISLSFAAKANRDLILQVIIAGMAFFILLAAFTIRTQPFATYEQKVFMFHQYCRPDSRITNPSLEPCTELHSYVTQLRIIESLQAVMTVFMDDGVALVTSLLQPSMSPDNGSEYISRNFAVDRFMYRHLLAAGVAVVMQLGLCGLCLSRAIRLANPKKK